MSTMDDTGTETAEDDGSSYLLAVADEFDEAMEVTEEASVIHTATVSREIGIQQIASDERHVSIVQIAPNDQYSIVQMEPRSQQVTVVQPSDQLGNVVQMEPSGQHGNIVQMEPSSQQVTVVQPGDQHSNIVQMEQSGQQATVVQPGDQHSNIVQLEPSGQQVTVVKQGNQHSNQHSNIVQMEPSGQQVTVVQPGDQHGSIVQMEPSGQQVTVVQDGDQHSNIVQLEPSGQQVTVVQPGDQHSNIVQMEPSGQQVTVVQPGDQHGSIVQMEPSGQQVTVVQDGDQHSNIVQMEPSGQQVTVVQPGDQHSNIVQMEPSGQQVTVVQPGDQHSNIVQMTPSGQQVTVVQHGNQHGSIVQMEPSGQQVTIAPNDQYVQILPSHQQVSMGEIKPIHQPLGIEGIASDLRDVSTSHVEVISQPLSVSGESETYTEIREKKSGYENEKIVLQVVPLKNNVTAENNSNERIKVIRKEQSIPMEVFPFVCGICSEKFKRLTTYFAHFKLHKDYESVLHSCNDSTVTPETPEGVEGRVSCGICNLCFPSMCLAHDHMLKVENLSDYRYHNYTVLPVYETVMTHSKQLHQDNANNENNEVDQSITSTETEVSPNIDHEKETNLADSATDGRRKSKRQKAKDKNLRSKEKEQLKMELKEPLTPDVGNQSRTKQSNAKGSDENEGENESSSSPKRKPKTPSDKKSASQMVLEKNFEMSTRRRTYTMTKNIIEKEESTPKRKQKTLKTKSTLSQKPALSQSGDTEENVEGEEVCSKVSQSEDGVILEVREVDDAETVEAIADYLVELSKNKTANYEHEESMDDGLDGTKPSTDNNYEQRDLMAHANSRVEDSLNKLQRMKRKQLLKNTKAAHIPCDICGRVLPRKGLARHRVVHLQSRDYQCDICDKTYKSRSHLSDHIRIVHAEREHVCIACGKYFKTVAALDKHKAVHLRRQEIDATTGELLVQQNDLKTPLNTAADVDTKVMEEEKIACKICDKVILKTSMSKHILAHSNVRRYKCEQCGAAFKLHSHLKGHINTVHLNVMNYKCSICKEAFKTSVLLLKHKTTHLDPDDEYYSEDVVAQLQQQQRDRELRRRNKMPKMIDCNVCGKTINYKRLNRHKSIHNKSKDFPCDICNKKFTTPRYVYDHKLKVHTNVRTFCDICGQFFKGKGYLEKHRQIHGPRDKVCTVCQKGFTTDFYLKMHMKTHTDVTAYNCEHCPAVLSSKMRLAVHLTDKHNIGEKRPCKYCFMKFPSRQRARVHERRVHEGYEDKRRLKRQKLNMKHESVTVGEEYHVILSQESVDVAANTDSQIQIVEKLDSSQEVTSVELINAAANSEFQDTVTHAQLLDAVLKSETEGEVLEGGGGQEEIIQHVVEIPESAEQVCALVMYPDGSYRLVNPGDIGPDVKVVAEVATR